MRCGHCYYFGNGTLSNVGKIRVCPVGGNKFGLCRRVATLLGSTLVSYGHYRRVPFINYDRIRPVMVLAAVIRSRSLRSEREGIIDRDQFRIISRLNDTFLTLQDRSQQVDMLITRERSDNLQLLDLHDQALLGKSNESCPCWQLVSSPNVILARLSFLSPR